MMKSFLTRGSGRRSFLTSLAPVALMVQLAALLLSVGGGETVLLVTAWTSSSSSSSSFFSPATTAVPRSSRRTMRSRAQASSEESLFSPSSSADADTAEAADVLKVSISGGGGALKKEQEDRGTATMKTNNKSSSSDGNNKSTVRSVNYFISRACNYSCKFCFHTAKTSHHLPLLKAMAGLRLLADAGTEKINFAGGEPFLNPTLLGELCQYCRNELNMAVSIISNGSLITQGWMEKYGQYVDILGVSVDSFDPQTNIDIGRTTGKAGVGIDEDYRRNQFDRLLRIRHWCDKYDITFKMNTVVCSLNYDEDFGSETLQQLDPQRWKVFQVLLLKNENSGLVKGELRNAQSMTVSNDQFWNFVNRHRPYLLNKKDGNDVLIPEPNDTMQNSYLLLDEELRFLDCSNGSKVPSQSILDVGVDRALQQSGFDLETFEKRGGIYNWKRNKKQQEQEASIFVS